MKYIKATVRHVSPPEGRKFDADSQTLSWGWREFAKADRICTMDMGYIFDMNKILIELEIKNVKVFYTEKIDLPAINPGNPFTTMSGTQFTVGGFAWRFLIHPNGESDETRGQILGNFFKTPFNYFTIL